MNAAKIRLSPAERELARNAEWILTKNGILEKIKQEMGELVYVQQELLEENLQDCFPEEVQQSGYKISQGEQYLGLPWVVLDHPRYFSKEDIMAVRTLFWWGKYYSVTLHLGGRYKEQFAAAIGSKYQRLQQAARQAEAGLGNRDFYISVNDNPWEHHLEAGNYRRVSECSAAEWETLIREKSFIKLAKKIPLAQWDKPYPINDVLAWHYYTLVELLEKGD